MAVAETVQHYLEQHSVEYDLLLHPHTGSSHGTAEAAHLREDHIAKAVIVKDNAGYAMVVVPASNWVDIEHLRKEFNRDFHLATEDELATLFNDCEAGAIPPLGPAYGIETFLDQALTSLANVYFEAGDHEQLVHTTGDDFRTLLGGVRHGYYSHDD
ncbi:MAG: YbaK/EbsC family protein [Gammaproteobacteria bacterium]|jgi:Ala-tRNA(Pro) deacylase|nr:YbaK/EbsC family protein [Gammaproteobacteria bacterium]